MEAYGTSYANFKFRKSRVHIHTDYEIINCSQAHQLPKVMHVKLEVTNTGWNSIDAGLQWRNRDFPGGGGHQPLCMQMKKFWLRSEGKRASFAPPDPPMILHVWLYFSIRRTLHSAIWLQTCRSNLSMQNCDCIWFQPEKSPTRWFYAWSIEHMREWATSGKCSRNKSTSWQSNLIPSPICHEAWCHFWMVFLIFRGHSKWVRTSIRNDSLGFSLNGAELPLNSGNSEI